MINKHILVSVVMITYNHEKYIRQAIDGVLMQKTNFQFELVIGEDFSDDNTRNICEEYAKTYPDKINLLESKMNHGMVPNFIRTLQSCHGKFIALCEGDDYWTDSNKLQKQIEFLEANPKYSICFHESLDIWDDGRKELHNNINENKVFTLKDFTRSNFISTATAVFRNGHSLPKWFRDFNSGDWALHFINAMKGDIYYMKDCMSVYRKHKNGAWSSMDPNKMLLEGVRTMMMIDKSTNFKYTSEFGKGIAERINKGEENKIKKYLIEDKSLADGLSRYLNLDTLKYSPNSNLNKKNGCAEMKISSNPNCSEFLNPKLIDENIDKYFIRTSILKSINNTLPLLKGTLLDLGCGKMPYRDYLLANSDISDYIGMDIENPIYQKDVKPDLFWDGKFIPMEDNSVDTVMATELFEHLPDIQSVLNEINRVLKPGGLLFFTVPFLWPLHDVPYDEYRYTPFALERHLKLAGLEAIQINPYGGWNASLAQMIGLWLKRSGLSDEDRNSLSQQLFPFYKQLLETDVVPQSYENGPMVPGFSGTARKSVPLIFHEKNKYKDIQVETKEHSFKVVVIVYFFPKLSETFILDQIVGLIKQGLDVEIWAQAIPEESLTHPTVIEYNLLSKVKYVQFPRVHLNGIEWKKEFLFSNKVDITDNDLFHVHFGQNFIAFQKLFMEINNPVVVSFHGLDASQYVKQNGADCYKVLFGRADLVTTPSYEMQNKLVSIGCSKERMIVHRYGVDTKKFSPSVIQDENGIIKLLTVARFVEKKGIEDSLKAFAKINPANAVYRIIGEGPLEKDYRDLVEQLGLNNKVHFLGPKPKEDIIKEMQDTDIYILTSVTAANGDKEGLPVTLIEAQSAGIPVVSTYHAGIPELVSDGETGFLCQEKDIDCIAEKMGILINNSDLRKKFSQNARRKVLDEFNIEKLNANLLREYGRVAKHRF